MDNRTINITTRWNNYIEIVTSCNYTVRYTDIKAKSNFDGDAGFKQLRNGPISFNVIRDEIIEKVKGRAYGMGNKEVKRNHTFSSRLFKLSPSIVFHSPEWLKELHAQTWIQITER